MKFNLIWATALLFFTFGAAAQKPVKWSFAMKDAGKGEFDIVMTGTIDEGWYTYSQFLESDEGPVATTVNFQEGPHFQLIGKAKEGWCVRRNGPLYQLYIIRKIGPLCLRVHYGHKLNHARIWGRPAMVVNISFSLVRWKGVV